MPILYITVIICSCRGILSIGGDMLFSRILGGGLTFFFQIKVEFKYTYLKKSLSVITSVAKWMEEMRG